MDKLCIKQKSITNYDLKSSSSSICPFLVQIIILNGIKVLENKLVLSRKILRKIFKRESYPQETSFYPPDERFGMFFDDDIRLIFRGLIVNSSTILSVSQRFLKFSLRDNDFGPFQLGIELFSIFIRFCMRWMKFWISIRKVPRLSGLLARIFSISPFQ